MQKTIEQLINMPVGNVITVGHLPKDDRIGWITDSTEVENFLQDVNATGYDSLFVIVGDGDLLAMFGMSGCVPRLSKLICKLA